MTPSPAHSAAKRPDDLMTVLPRKLGLVDATAIVIGDVVGTAIFLVPNSVAQDLPSAAMILAVWIVTGVLSFFGALAYAELGAMIPSTGGQYVFLRDSYGPLWGFLCGWSFILAIYSGANATLAVGFATYLSYFVHLTPLLFKLAAVALVAILTLVNYRGVELGAATQRFFTLLSLCGLVAIIGSALASRQSTAIEWSLPASIPWSHFGVAMIACLWAYEGWSSVSFVAGEIKEPQRNLPLSLGLGVAIIVALYVLANVAYLKILPISTIASTERVAATMAERTIGPLGASLVALTVLLSTAGCTNAGAMTGPRIYFAQARDGLFFRKIGDVHPRFQTPSFSILVQGIVTAVLAVSGSYEKLFSYVTFVAWVFYGLTVTGVLVLRRKYPDLPRPYKMWGYPVTPVLFAAIAFGFVINTLVTTPGPSLKGIAIVASGVPVYYVWKRKALARL
jgi:basic amino acid/polyamine antiporter, APA family